MNDFDRFFSLRDAANLISVTDETLRKWIRGGKLTEFRVEGSRALRVSEAELLTLVRVMPHPSRLRANP